MRLIAGAMRESTRMKSIRRLPRAYVVGVSPSASKRACRGSSNFSSDTKFWKARDPVSSHSSLASIMSIGRKPSRRFSVMSCRKSSRIRVRGSRERSPSMIILLSCWE